MLVVLMMSGKYLTARSDKVMGVFLPFTLSLALSKFSYSPETIVDPQHFGGVAVPAGSLWQTAGPWHQPPLDTSTPAGLVVWRFACKRS